MSDFLISRIESQKKRKNRFSIFTENKFLVGVSDETMLKYGLQVGKSISQNLLQELQNNEDYISLKNSALGLLARRPHSVKELKDKLFKKNSNVNLINSIVENFKTYKYLDDEMFAQAYLTDEIRLKKSGPLLIKNKLLQKGVNPETINTVIENDYDISIQISNCEILANKKFRIISQQLSLAEKKSKLANYLKQKGYHWEIVKQVIEPLINGENDEE
jgi:regulatory protein